MSTTPQPSAPTYHSVPAHIDLPAMEHAILQRWAEQDTFTRSLTQSEGGPRWVFFEGPPTANGTPGTHHVEARVFKDVFPRYRTMKGYYVERKAGWDCHGLPVELAVEKELGFSGKPDIERYGIAEFNAKCRESVLRHVGEFEQMTERMGYWVNTDDAYWTMNTSYVESLWWSLKQIHAKGLLVEDYRVAPYCARCGTTLSDHELGLGGYEEVTDPSVFVRFPATESWAAQLATAKRVSFLVWTTTPWTLVSNTAIAVHPQVEYVAVDFGEAEPDVVIVAEALLSSLQTKLGLGEDAPAPSILGRWQGSELEGVGYQPPLDVVDASRFASPEGATQPAWTVLLADYVTTDDGTGMVHQAPAFGEEDLATCRGYGLPVVNPIRPDGHFEAHLPLVGGIYFKEADLPVVDELRTRGLLFAHQPYPHQYPHCWRCHKALIYYAAPAWYIRTTAVRDALLRENAATDWHPETIKEGRYGDWLRNNIDWALSRNRYWGTPLPVWRCENKHLTVIGSLAELGELAGKDLTELDPHRPYIDEITFACPHTEAGTACGLTARRDPAVLDAWYDSGSMPFAQWGYPHQPGSEEVFAQRYPADYICEAIDQTRGWFYTLMAVGTLVFDKSSYETVLCLGHILAEDGRKMSKHLGNILLPIPLMDTHGADAVRWFMLAGGSPWQPRRIGDHILQEVVRKVLLTYWNTVSFQALYGSLSDFAPGAHQAPPPAQRPVLDRWALSKAHTLVREVDAALGDYDTQRAGSLIAEFIDDLSNWYVRRSRRRFWKGDHAALATLHECLKLLTLVMAPLTPFITEQVWGELFTSTEHNLPDSVHLSRWPDHEATLIDPELESQMALVRRVVELGRASRAASGVKTRQPLLRALVSAAGWAQVSEQLRAEIADELNVATVETLNADTGELVDHSAKANFRTLGRRFGSDTPKVAAAIAAADPTALAAALEATGEAEVAVAGNLVRVSSEEVILTTTPRQGWAVETAAGESVALDLTLTPELVRAGLARETIRLVQEARKTAGFEVSDRIYLWWQAEGELAQALNEHSPQIAEEVLAIQLSQGRPPAAAGRATHLESEMGLTLWLSRV